MKKILPILFVVATCGITQAQAPEKTPCYKFEKLKGFTIQNQTIRFVPYVIGSDSCSIDNVYLVIDTTTKNYAKTSPLAMSQEVRGIWLAEREFPEDIKADFKISLQFAEIVNGKVISNSDVEYFFFSKRIRLITSDHNINTPRPAKVTQVYRPRKSPARNRRAFYLCDF